MAGVPPKVLNWLYSVLTSEYADVNRTYHDVAEALSNYPSLSPRTEVYTHENGASALLLRLGGTVPVTFRDQTYGFPIAIWIPHNYPRESPIVYVTPSQDMLVRPGQHVSGDGRVYHPYLAQWGKYWDKSTLFDFLAVLRGVFAKEPPVRSKQHYNAPPPAQPPPVPPTPVELRKSHGTPVGSPAPGAFSNAPAPPPKPPKPYEQTGPSPRPQDRYSQPPPLPPHTTQQNTPAPPPPPHVYQQQYQQPQGNGYAAQNQHWQQQGPPQTQHHQAQRQSNYDMSPATPVSRHGQVQGAHSYDLGSPVSPITPEDQQRASRYKPPPPQQPANYTAPQQYQPPLPHVQEQQQQYSQPPFSQPPQPYPPQPYPQYQPPQQPKQPPPPPPNLMDDVDILSVTIPSQNGPPTTHPVPPVPPNPEKDALLQALSTTLISQISQTVEQNLSALPALGAQQAALQTAHKALQSELSQLQQLDAALTLNEKILREAMLEADRVMDDAKRRKVPDVDDVLVAPTVVGGQLYTLCAEERGIEECLFLLGKALDRGRVSVDGFVKQTRSLAREQFLKKALVKKIAKGMGLDDYGMR